MLAHMWLHLIYPNLCDIGYLMSRELFSDPCYSSDLCLVFNTSAFQFHYRELLLIQANLFFIIYRSRVSNHVELKNNWKSSFIRKVLEHTTVEVKASQSGGREYKKARG